MLALNRFTVIAIICYFVSTSSATCPSPKTPNINRLADYTTQWKQLRVCNQLADTAAVLDRLGRWFISYSATATSDTNTSVICKCLQDFFLQSIWTKNAHTECIVECRRVTLLIVGVPNLSFIGRKPVYETQPPIVSLAEITGKFPNADMGGSNCNTVSGINKEGLEQVSSTCDFGSKDSASACKTIYDYLNVSNWLDNSTTTTCVREGSKVTLNIIAKNKVFDQ